MITSKQRAYLRGLAQNLTPIFQIGKKGIEEKFIVQVKEALEKREIIKIKVLENSGMDVREASEMLCEAVGAEGIQAIGNKMVLYKQSEKNQNIKLPVASK